MKTYTPIHTSLATPFQDFYKGAVGKAVVQVVPALLGSAGATINVYIQSNTATFSQDYDCNGNPVSNLLREKRAVAACAAPGNSPDSTTTSAPPELTLEGEILPRY